MAGGPIFPFSAVANDTTGQITIGTHVGSARNFEGMRVADASTLSANRTFNLLFAMPVGSLPSGQLKLQVWATANATSGNLVLNPQWALSNSYDSVSLNDEGNMSAITFSTAHVIVEQTISLDAITPTADSILVMNLIVVDASTTVAAVSTFQAMLIWE